MALSKIWAAFILISIVVAGVRYAFVPADKEIFGMMVTGKSGDSVRLAPSPVSLRDSARPGVGTATTGAAAAVAPGYVVQKADGLIETCKNAVLLALGLVGIMALFMGLVNIAEVAGGGGVLARGGGAFF